MIDKENISDPGHISIHRKVESCWDRRLAMALMSKTRDENLKPENMGVLLETLIDHGVQDAESFAKSFLSTPVASESDKQSKAVVAARVLVMHSKDAGWSIVWPAILSSAELGKEIVIIVAQREGWGRRTGIWEKLDEDQLSELYIWLSRQYPQSEDPQRDGTGAVSPRESMAHWRDAILENLKYKGTLRACDAIRRIQKQLPELTWLKWTLFDAEAVARRLTWVPLKPTDVLKLASDREVRLVQNGDQLLDAIIESLSRLEIKLQGETPSFCGTSIVQKKKVRFVTL